MKEYIIVGIIIGIVLILGLYFFKYEPDIKEAYQKGLNERIYVQGKDSIIYKDTSFTVQTTKPVTKPDLSDSILMEDVRTSSLDTSMVSGKDTIKVHAEVSVYSSVADWFMKIDHKNYETIRIDTIKTPIETVKVSNNWFITFLAYLGGIISVILIYLL